MKSLIDYPEEVVTPSSSSIVEHNSCQTMEKTISFHTGVCLDSESDSDSDSDTDQTTSSTITDSVFEDSQSDAVDSVSDFDEKDNTIHYDINAADKDDTNDKTTGQRRSVSFGPIHVRQYERIVGDHPETKVGVPLAIGWAYYEDDMLPNGISIERYEADRIYKGKIRMSSITRKNMLLNVFGLAEKDILMAEKRSKKLLKQRGSSKSESTLKTIGTKVRKSGITFLKGMSNVAQMGIGGGVTGLSAAVEHAF